MKMCSSEDKCVSEYIIYLRGISRILLLMVVKEDIVNIVEYAKHFCVVSEFFKSQLCSWNTKKEASVLTTVNYLSCYLVFLFSVLFLVLAH